MQRRSNLIAFPPDFSAVSLYPGIVKAVIYGIHPRDLIVDLVHSLPPFDVEITRR